jgi:VanZ family protein
MKMLKYWKPILVAIIIFYGSISSGENLNKVGILHFKYSDKIVHFIFYFSLSITLLTALYKNSNFLYKKQIIATLTISILYGLLMEFFQYAFTQTRSAEFLDVISNTVGAIIGITLFPLIVKHRFIKFL